MFLEAVREEEQRCGTAIDESADGLSSPRIPCPLDDASAVDRVMFNWVNSLVEAGARSPVEERQLWGVSWRDSAAYLRASVVTAWNIERGSAAAVSEKERKEGKGGKKPSLLRATLMAFQDHRWAGLLLPCISFVKVTQAFALGRLIERMASGRRDCDRGGDDGSEVWFWDTTWGLSTTLVLLGFVTFQLWHQYFLSGWRVGMQLRTAMVAMIYHKALRLSLAALGRVTIGNVVNLATNDIEKFQVAGVSAHYFWAAPLEAVVVLGLGINELGVSFLFGFVLLLAIIPVQSYFGKQFGMLRRSVAADTDERVKLTSQCVSAARLVKASGWELLFAEKIKGVREREMAGIKKASVLRAVNEAIFFTSSAVVALVTFATHVQLLRKPINNRQLFTTLGLFNVVQFSMTKFFMLAVEYCSSAYVSLQRLQTFLELEEVGGVAAASNVSELPHAASSGRGNSEHNERAAGEIELSQLGESANLEQGGGEEVASSSSLSNSSSSPPPPPPPLPSPPPIKQDVSLSLQNATVTWDDIWPVDVQAGGNRDRPSLARGDALENVTLQVKRGEVLGIVGPVGAGKSTLLMAVLGEARVKSGSIRFPATAKDEPTRCGFAAQEPFILSGTVRDNVLFGAPFEDAPYRRILEACELGRDLSRLPDGDRTVIGERGVNLSGGQRARIGLARACYLGLCGGTPEAAEKTSGSASSVGAGGAVAPCELFLLDDPLSAVDPAVGRRLFDKVIAGPDALLKGKTVLLVTHQLQYLSSHAVQKVVALEKGRVVATGKYTDVKVALSQLHLKDEAETARGRLDDDDDDDDDDDWKGSDGERGKGDDQISGAAKANVSVAQQSFLSPSEEEVQAKEKLAKTLVNVEETDSKGRHNSDDRSAALDRKSEPKIRDVSVAGDGDKKAQGDDKGGDAGLIGQEQREVGEVRLSTYLNFLAAGGGVGTILVLVALLLSAQVLMMGVQIWLAAWTQAEPLESSNKEDTITWDDDEWGIGGQGNPWWTINYALLTAGAIVFAFARSLACFFTFLSASQQLHDRALLRVVRAPMLFFDSNPIGRVLNKFSKDTGYMDDLLPMTFYDFLQCVTWCAASVVLACIINPFVFLVVAPLLLCFVRLRSYFIKTSREVKRLDAVSRSPIYSSLSETLDGLVAVRAFGRSQLFQRRFLGRLDTNTRSYFAFICTSRWLGYRLDAMSFLLLIASTLLAAAAYESSKSTDKEGGGNKGGNPFTNAAMDDPGLLGLSLLYVIQLSGLGQWTVRQSAELENQMVSVERVLEYTKLPQEDALVSPGGLSIAVDNSNAGGNDGTSDVRSSEAMVWDPLTRPRPKQWPLRGSIVAENLVVSYRPGLEPTLKGLSFVIEAGERVGIVGRTGAGKSSLMMAMLRLVEPRPPSPTTTDQQKNEDGTVSDDDGGDDDDLEAGRLERGGRILIDGTDTALCGLHDLRHGISVIMQQPFLFAASVRENLDPFGRHSGGEEDAVLWAALRDVQMDRAVRDLPGGLDCQVAESGQNFSVGEQQLLCLARAFLEETRVLLVDEATASIDQATDAVIQHVIRTKFKGCTVIAVAHRLSTVIDSDRILVLNDGRVVENDHPHILLTSAISKIDGKGAFESMVEECGPAMAEELRKYAADAYRKKNKNHNERAQSP